MAYHKCLQDYTEELWLPNIQDCQIDKHLRFPVETGSLLIYMVMASTHMVMASTHMVMASTRMVMASTHMVMASTRMVMASTHMVMASTRMVMASTRMVMATTHMVMASTHMVMASTHMVMASTRMVMASTRMVMASTHMVMASTHMVMASTRMVMASTRMVMASTRMVMASTQAVHCIQLWLWKGTRIGILCCSVKTWVKFFHCTLLQFIQLYGSRQGTNSFHALIAAWLDASQRSRDGVWLNRSAREVKWKALWAVLRTGYCAI